MILCLVSPTAVSLDAVSLKACLDELVLRGRAVLKLVKEHVAVSLSDALRAIWLDSMILTASGTMSVKVIDRPVNALRADRIIRSQEHPAR